uniref:(northern house mosquito) hypothetical protein n=2 Tax=Culex pipiens TaxID=7175 RepID=A0A8D8FPC3_CULPI
MNSLKYSCSCDSKRRRVVLNRFHDPAEAAQLDKALDTLVDSAWDDEDEDADELLCTLIKTLKSSSSNIPEDQLMNLLERPPDESLGRTNLILSNDRTCDDEEDSCHCREISHNLSLVLNMGFSELHSSSEPNERVLSDLLDQLVPFSECFAENLEGFLRQTWHYAVRSSKSNLINRLVAIFPKEVDSLVEKILKTNFVDSTSIQDNDDFISLANIICNEEVFRHVSLHLAENYSNYPNSQSLISAIVRYVKSNIAKSKFLKLYSTELSSIVAILNEAINPDDPLVLALLEQVKQENYFNFLILVTHFPLFLHLK